MKPVGKGSIMNRTISLTLATFTALLFLLALTPAGVLAQLNGSLYAVQGAPVPEFFNFSVSGQTWVATILTFGTGGNGRWFAAFGTTDGVSGTGQVIIPAVFTLMQPGGASMQFQLDQPGGPAGSFTIKGLEAFLSLSSGRFVRVFP
jgi:hypothetical protein